MKDSGNVYTGKHNTEFEGLLKTFYRLQADGMAGINKKGNRQVLSYYSGVTGTNPSGNKNLESIAYYDSRGLLHTETFTYDADDDIIEINAD